MTPAIRATLLQQIKEQRKKKEQGTAANSFLQNKPFLFLQKLCNQLHCNRNDVNALRSTSAIDIH